MYDEILQNLAAFRGLNFTIMVRKRSRWTAGQRDYYNNAMQVTIISFPLDKMAAISQTTYSEAFSWMEKNAFWLKCHWSLFLTAQLTMEPMLTFFTHTYMWHYRGRWVKPLCIVFFSLWKVFHLKQWSFLSYGTRVIGSPNTPGTHTVITKRHLSGLYSHETSIHIS